MYCCSLLNVTMPAAEAQALRAGRRYHQAVKEALARSLELVRVQGSAAQRAH